MKKIMSKVLFYCFIASSTLAVAVLSACSGATKAGNTSDSETPSLKDEYSNIFTLGLAVSKNHLDAPAETGLIKKHFGSITAENYMKPAYILREGFTYNYEAADRIAAFARENNLKLRGHTLVWHNQTPDWFFTGENGEPLDSAALYRRLDDYMRNVMTHFGNDVYCWDVVNEALADEKGEMYRTNSPWYRACGENFIAEAFRMARRTDANVKLFYNDYNLTNPEKRDKAYRLLKKLKEEGVPVDGVGMQGHWSMPDITREDIQKSIDMFASLGLDIQITELDLTVYTTYHGEGANNQAKETVVFTPELAQRQAETYKMIFETLRANSDKISSVTFWGLADNHTWLSNFPVRGRTDYPLLFDGNLSPKPAFWTILPPKE